MTGKGNNSSSRLKSRFRGALIGSAVGDALGAPVEGCTMEEVSSFFGGRWELKSAHYTDDTEMMIGVAESLIERRGFDAADMACKFLRNYHAWRHYGPGTRAVLERLKAGESWEEASTKVFNGEGSYGNGAAMRIAPIGLFYYDDPDTLWEVAYKASHITHSHVLGKEGAAIQAYSVALALRGERGGMLTYLGARIKEERYRDKLAKIEQFMGMDADPGANSYKKALIEELGNGEAAFNSVPTAIYSFLRFYSFSDSVIYAVSLGGDTDTIGAMTGAISGAYYGEEAIPPEWLRALEGGMRGRRYIEWLGDELYRIKIIHDSY